MVSGTAIRDHVTRAAEIDKQTAEAALITPALLSPLVRCWHNVTLMLLEGWRARVRRQCDRRQRSLLKALEVIHRSHFRENLLSDNGDARRETAGRLKAAVL